MNWAREASIATAPSARFSPHASELVLFVLSAWLGSGGQSLHHSIGVVGRLLRFHHVERARFMLEAICIWANDRGASGGPSFCSATAAADSTICESSTLLPALPVVL